jgi:hypothetical protein
VTAASEPVPRRRDGTFGRPREANVEKRPARQSLCQMRHLILKADFATGFRMLGKPMVTSTARASIWVICYCKRSETIVGGTGAIAVFIQRLFFQVGGNCAVVGAVTK